MKTEQRINNPGPLENTKITRYEDIDWRGSREKVLKFQMRIAVATKTGNYKLVRTLQKTLISTFEARAWAVRQVVTNKGGKTPGVDKVVWTSAESKMKAIENLKIKAKYKASPVRRILIPKEGTDKFRALGIPTMKDRAMQALHALALIPAAECTADPNSYGYRPYKSAQDAMTYLKTILDMKGAPVWILDADITGFFDNITHLRCVMNNIKTIDPKVASEARSSHRYERSEYSQNG